MANPQFLPPKGFRDLLPPQMAIRNKVITILTRVFTNYGFLPLQTPTIEYAHTLMGKYGEEADKLLYLFKDRGDREIGLNYDLTVPTARVLAAYPELAKPFKRFQIQSAYRAENTQKGRYRQFTQCDIDILGSDSPLADAEILAVINDSLEALDLADFSINFNSRVVLYKLCDDLGIKSASYQSFLQTIDKSDKLTPEEIDEELDRKGFNKFYKKTVSPKLLALQERFVTKNTTGDDFLDEVYRQALNFGVPSANLRFQPFTVRGLDYYTGPIFETVVTKPKIGSLTGGGRYDHLIKQLGGPDLAAVGTTIGLDRLVDVISDQKLWPEVSGAPFVYVTVFSTSLASNSLKLAQALREEGISTDVHYNLNDRLDKQLKLANKHGYPYVVIIGDEEAKNNTAVLKDMNSGQQEVLSIDALIKKLSSLNTSS